MQRARLDPDAIRKSLETLDTATTGPWSVVDDKLHKVFEFRDFVAAFGFMSSAALIAESMSHHPDWSNVYNRVTVNLSTHDAGGITELDFELARRMDGLTGTPAGAQS